MRSVAQSARARLLIRATRRSEHSHTVPSDAFLAVLVRLTGVQQPWSNKNERVSRMILSKEMPSTATQLPL